mgnify:CR=1 FL=1
MDWGKLATILGQIVIVITAVITVVDTGKKPKS